MRTPADCSRVQCRARGFSLIEMIVSIVTLGVALTAVAVLIYPAIEESPEPAVQIRAVELGQAYLDEILGKRYDANTGQGGTPRCDSSDPGAQACTAALGPEAPETRALFDDVDDYHGLDDSPPVDALGNARGRYARYRVQVQVSYAGSALGLADERDAKRVDVTVTSPLGDQFPFSAYRVNF